jgi:23S rRNA pseudouridine2605 synthase
MYQRAMPTNKNDGSPATSPSSPALHRIAKLLARAGVASRREIERMITEGRVAFQGAIVDTPATLLASLDGVTVDGNPVAEAEPARLFLYHKPTGLLTTERDPAGRPTIYDRLPAGLPRLMPVGRLDLNTEGLLLMTTDGGLKRQLELPATGVERAYRARAYGQVSQPQLEELIHGIEIEGVRYGPIDANIERRTGANLWIEMILKEGKNREVRRVLEHLGLQVSRLIRTRYGPFVLGDLPPGQIGEVRRHDVESFSAEPTRRELPQPARRRSVEPIAPPVDARPKVEPEGRVKRPARPRPVAAKKEPRQRADGSVATRAGSARSQRTRAFRTERNESEAPARTATPRTGARPASASSARSTDRPAAARPRTDGDRPERARGGRSGAGASPRSASPGTARSPSDRPRDDRPRTDRPGGDRPRTDRPGGDRPRGDRSGADRPRTDRPGGDRPRGAPPRSDGARPGGSRPGGPRPTGPGKPGPKSPRGGR